LVEIVFTEYKRGIDPDFRAAGAVIALGPILNAEDKYC